MSNDESSAAWKPLSENARRVLGVLIEKAKTTPDSYPLSAAAIVTGSNQKSNRAPQMHLDEDDVHFSIEELKSLGVVVEIQGGGRVSKFRHLAYDWFDVKAPEIAVLTELLLRGPQTIGELRTRASRMHPFKDVSEIQPVIDQLVSKELVFPLTPPGRGQQFTHLVYEEDELARVKDRGLQSVSDAPSTATTKVPAASSSLDTEVAELKGQLQMLTEVVEQLKDRLDRLES